MSLFDTIQQIVDTAAWQGGGDGRSDNPACRYHRRIVSVGTCFAVLGLVIGLAVSLLVATESDERGTGGIIVVPLMMATGGFFFGMAIMCMAAPREFLTGPTGQAWMKLIGTANVTVARIACLLFGLVVATPFLLMGAVVALK
jgi:hypothetical protein